MEKSLVSILWPTQRYDREAVAMQLEGTVYDLEQFTLITLSEIVMEAALGAIDRPIHI